MTKTLCLNMIVKNESKVIKRLLESVKDIIDCYCICDTGSTDNTIEIIEDYFKSIGIPGKIVTKEFTDFGTNRTYALNEAKGMADYALLLDADMVLKIGTGKNAFNKNYLNLDYYSVLQGNDNFQYYNTRILGLHLDVTVKSPTHEYYDIHTKNAKSGKLSNNIIFIEDIGDGGSKANKFKRDIELLLKGIITEPNNSRYHFYLANSYYDSGQFSIAIGYYNKLIQMGSWIEEVFYSHLRLGYCYLYLKNEAKMVEHWLLGYQTLPTRSETLYELIKYYRLTSRHYLCNLFYQIAKNIKYPTDCSLFIHKDVYDYLLFEEYTIFAYYIGKRDIHNEFFELMHKKQNSYEMLSNYKFYQPVLKHEHEIKIDLTFDRNFFGHDYSFVSSTPSVCTLGENYILNVRCVNYKINPDGSYPYYKNIVSINKKVVYSRNFEIKSITELSDECSDRQYIGVEDIKLINYNSEIYFTGTGYHKDNKIGIVSGKYPMDSKKLEISEYQNITDCEKNWVYVPIDGKLKVVYKWFPLTIGDIVDNKFVTTTTTSEYPSTPSIFSLCRGSTNGYIFNGEIYFLVHMVYHNEGSARDYYHSLVVFSTDMKLKRYTCPFKFTTGEIEYSTGLVVEESRIIITHSVWDRESYIKIYNTNVFEPLFKIVK